MPLGTLRGAFYGMEKEEKQGLFLFWLALRILLK